MTEKNINRKVITILLSNTAMVIFTLAFILLYAAAFTGKLDPFKDSVMLLKIEPVTFILIGYYFARLPSWLNEQSLKDEITRQTQKADAAQHVKEKALQEREMLEEKMKNAKIALKTTSPLKTGANAPSKNEYFQAVINILDS